MKKKISFIFVFVVFFLLLCVKNVYAHSYDISNVEFTVDDYCIVEMSDGNIYLLTPKSTTQSYIAYMTSDNNRTYNTIFATGSDYSNYNIGQLKRYKLEDNKFVFFDYYWWKNDILTINSVIYSTCDIKYINDTSKIFFQVPPPLGVALAVEKVGGQELKQVMKEILGVLPLILSVLVSLLALRKGLSLLLSFLKTS